VQDPPISQIDLVTCRNTLMYFAGEVQGKILASFHFALNSGGYLFLGKAEALVTRRQMFDVVDLRQHIFRKDGSPAGIALLAPPSPGRSKITRKTADQLPEVVFENSLVAQVVLDASGAIVLANRAARRLLPIGSTELGRHLRDAEFSLRPVDLRTPADQVLRDRRPVSLYDVPWHVPMEEPVTLDITVSPLEGQGGALITFLDVSRYQHLREQPEQSRRELETVYEVLQSTVEELETTNEELQTTNEEVETTNEELETINNELRERSAEVIELNQFQESILGSLQYAVIVLGVEMEVRAWNRHAEELWGRRSDEVLGQHFLNLDIGFPVDRLRNAIRDILLGREERGQITAPAVNRRGQPVDCAVNASCLVGRGETRGVILMMDAMLRDGTDGTAEASDQAGHTTSGTRSAGAAGGG
jgi:two-component system CheB/CheR fusion protein